MDENNRKRQHVAPSGEEPKRFTERRRGKKDRFSILVNTVAGAGLAFTVATLILLDRASPAAENFFTRFFNAPVVSYWNGEYIKTAIIVMFVSFLLCAAGFILSLHRTRRKTDRYNRPTIVLGLVSLAGLIVMLIVFRDFL